MLLFLFCFFFFRLTANKVSDYCKLINEEDGHMGDTRVGVWNAGRDYTHKMGEKGQECPTLKLRVPGKMIVCVRDTTAAK